ncbi:MAG: hydrolase [Phycisphaerales bacterium]|nr:MAG: hydrolase [Phycisphaerales bacterium]
MLTIDDCCLVVVDVQGKLAQLMHEKEALFKNIRILIEAARILGIPIVWCQQAPDALGPTIPEVAELLAGVEPIDKVSFSCCGGGGFNEALAAAGTKQVLLCGIEAHVCIWQTAMELLGKGLDVHVAADAVSSRSRENKQVALDRMAAKGADIVSTEMAIFELLGTAEHPDFRRIAKLLK